MSDITFVIPICRSLDLPKLKQQLSHFKAETKTELILVIDEFYEQDLHQISTEYLRNLEIKLQVIKGKFGNPGSARNAALSLGINSQWLQFLDADDEADIQRIVDTARKTNSTDYSAIIFDFQTIDNLKRVKVYETRNLYQLARNPGLWRITLNTSLLNNSIFPEISIGEDQIFLLRSGILGGNLYFAHEVAYSHEIKSGSNISQNPKNFAQYRVLLDILKDEMDTYIIERHVLDIFLLRIILGAIKRKITLNPKMYLFVIVRVLNTFKSKYFFDFLAFPKIRNTNKQ